MMNKITEHDIRRAILQRTDLNASTKLTVLALLLKVDWATMQGPATVPELSKLCGQSKRSTQYGIKQLETAGLLKRGWVEIGGKMLPMFYLNAQAMAEGVQTLQGGANSAGGCKSCMGRGAKSAGGGCKICRGRGANSAPLQLDNYNSINTQLEKGSFLAFEDKHNLSSTHQLMPTQHPLTADMINALESQGHTGHAERVQYAREHLNIKLLKGGYYEQI